MTRGHLHWMAVCRIVATAGAARRRAGSAALDQGSHPIGADRMTTPGAGEVMDVPSQPVTAPLTPAAIFLVVTVNPGAAAETAVRSLCPDLANLLRAVGFRDLDGGLSCIMALGSAIWCRLFGEPRPAELHPFREIRAGSRHAVATPGDILFHIRAQRMDLCFELATQIMARLKGAGSP